jgi:ankyrin repeat protein
VKYGADINAKDEEGYTPLAKAINFTDQTNQDVIDYLRSLGAKE